MTDPFSMAASSFAVVGVADVVLRASVELCRFLSEIKDAPAEVERLRDFVMENTLLVEHSKQFLEELKRRPPSASALDVNLSGALYLFTSAIRALRRELNALAILARKHNGSNKSWGRIKWVLDERKINKSFLAFETSKTTLNNALALVSRFVDPLMTYLCRS